MSPLWISHRSVALALLLFMLVTLVLAGFALLGVRWSPPSPQIPDYSSPSSEIASFLPPSPQILEEINQRPLFHNDRRPDSNHLPQPAPQTAGELSSAVLHGVYSTSDQLRVALVSLQGKSYRLRPNDSLAGWNVSSIDPSGIQFTSPENPAFLLQLKRLPQPEPAQPTERSLASELEAAIKRQLEANTSQTVDPAMASPPGASDASGNPPPPSPPPPNSPARSSLMGAPDKFVPPKRSE